MNISVSGKSAANTKLRNVEIYHPTKRFNFTLPDLPSDLEKLSGFWFNETLLFCGLKMPSNYFTCYELKHIDGYVWQENEHLANR